MLICWYDNVVATRGGVAVKQVGFRVGKREWLRFRARLLREGKSAAEVLRAFVRRRGRVRKLAR